jgi:Flp pilus assembly protein TadD
LEVRPDYVPARLLKAALDSADKNFAAAEQELGALAQTEPDNALVYRQMAAFDDARGRAADAEKNWIRALELKPESQDILRDLILFYIRGKQTDKAIQRINVIPDAKKEAVHYELLGIAYSQSGKPQDAESAYKKALEKDPSRTSAGVHLLEGYMASGRNGEALNTLDGMIKKNPSDASLLLRKALIFENQGKRQEAKQIYAQALKIDPDFLPAANNLAYILAEEGSDLQTALKYAQEIRRKQPDNPFFADTLGWILYKSNNHVLARAQLEFAVSKQPDNAEFLYHLGMIYKANKQTSQAETALKKAANSSGQAKEKGLAQAALKEISGRK